MAPARYIAHPHRHNPDGSVESICINCFATIARAGDKAALTEQEKKHSCDRQVLAYRKTDRLKVKAHAKLEPMPSDTNRPESDYSSPCLDRDVVEDRKVGAGVFSHSKILSVLAGCRPADVSASLPFKLIRRLKSNGGTALDSAPRTGYMSRGRSASAFLWV
jgi:hypothetical protein